MFIIWREHNNNKCKHVIESGTVYDDYKRKY